MIVNEHVRHLTYLEGAGGDAVPEQCLHRSGSAVGGHRKADFPGVLVEVSERWGDHAGTSREHFGLQELLRKCDV